MVWCRSSLLNQNKPFSGMVLTLMSSSRLRAVGLRRRMACCLVVELAKNDHVIQKSADTRRPI